MTTWCGICRFEKIRNYIERNPVWAGLVIEASDYRWSSAGSATGGSPADHGETMGSAPPAATRKYKVRSESLHCE
jgi:hypothetical protein